MSCYKNEYILDNISRILVQKIQKKLSLTFLITYFQYRQVLQTYFIIYGEFKKQLTLMTVSRHDGVIKKSCDLDYYFVFFNDPMQYYTHAKFHSQGLTGSGFMEGGPFRPEVI